MAPVAKFGAGEESFGRLPYPVGFRHRYAELREKVRYGDAAAAVAHEPVGEHSRVAGETSSGVSCGNPSEPLGVRVDFVPEISRFRRGDEDVLAQYPLSGLVLISFVAPFHEPFGRQVADIVSELRPFFVERSKPRADVFRTDSVVSGLLDAVRETGTVPRNPSSDRFHRFLRHGARIFEEFDPEAPFVEKAR